MGSKEFIVRSNSRRGSAVKRIVCLALVNGKRVKGETGLIHAGLIIIDIDNQADGKDQDGNKIQKQELTWEQAQELDICKKYLSLAYDSPSTKPGWPRFRLVFGLEKPIIDGEFYNGSLELYQKIFLVQTYERLRFRIFFMGQKQATASYTQAINLSPPQKLTKL